MSNQSLPTSSEITAAMQTIDVLAAWLESSGLSSGAIAQWKFNCLATLHPSLQDIVESAKALIGTTQPLPETGMSVTELANNLTERLQKKIKPADVNIALVNLGLQVRVEEQMVWQLTEKGREYGEAFLATSRTNSWSGSQVKWFAAVIPNLEEYFQLNKADSSTSKTFPAQKGQGEYLFAGERIKEKGLKVTASQLMQIELFCADYYKERHGKPPSQQPYKRSRACAIPVADADIVDRAIAKILKV